jgi:hypothetical protein
MVGTKCSKETLELKLSQSVGLCTTLMYENLISHLLGWRLPSQGFWTGSNIRYNGCGPKEHGFH